MKIQNVTDEAFRTYGTVIEQLDCSDMLAALERMPVPADVVYVPSCPELTCCRSMGQITGAVFGGMSVQAGVCCGHNRYLNAVEYHKCSEVNIAATDLILLLGRQQDIGKDFTYQTELMEAFFVPKGTVVEVYATTLHYAPCESSVDGFKWAVILPKGTNTELEKRDGCNLPQLPEEKLLYAKNKWLIAHADAGIAGAFAGLTGENLKV